MDEGVLRLPSIPAVDWALEPLLLAKLVHKAKPPGSLGRVEELAVRLGVIQGRLDPALDRILALIFAADHGLTDQGVSSYPASVTAAMVRLFLSGQATVNAFARAASVGVRVVDAGVAADLPAHPDLIDAKIRRGSRNAAIEPALTGEEVRAALARGVALAESAADEGFHAIALGEMGIGNTAASALLMHRLLPAPLDACIGAGAGQTEDGMKRKRAAIAAAARRSAATDPFDVLSQFGGLEIAMMAGAAIGAASRRRVVIVDGFISSVAALAAVRLAPATLDYCVFAHRSAEQGHALLLLAFGVDPLLDLGLRLGEGSGAVLAAPLLRAAARLLSDVADLGDVVGPR
jgi:nicotinate-nucleotide--dimethylbenzimidazole phosphoribosyltransferase